jgi:oxepin-CoA hydrolase/3-oxo-5,6-dehydrosuberyl-CoA semialdehyde dehydrogenase
MNKFIDMNDRQLLQQRFAMLKPDAQPLWGKMTPRQMVEHLVVSVAYTNGKKHTTCNRPADAAERDKNRAVYGDTEIPKNVILEELPGIHTYPDLSTAVDALMAELLIFDQYFKQPGVTEVHAAFGPLNHHEWLLWHGKHFTHHLKQFGLWG